MQRGPTPLYGLAKAARLEAAALDWRLAASKHAKCQPVV